MTDYPLMGMANFAPNHIFVIGEAMHCKFCVLFDTEEYWCMHDRLSPKTMCCWSSDFFIILGNKW